MHKWINKRIEGKIDMNTEAFIQSAEMQMKAHNAPGSIGSRRMSAPSIYTSAIIFLIMLVFTRAAIWKKLSAVLVRFSRCLVFPDGSGAQLWTLFERLIGRSPS